MIMKGFVQWSPVKFFPASSGCRTRGPDNRIIMKANAYIFILNCSINCPTKNIVRPRLSASAQVVFRLADASLAGVYFGRDVYM